ncbi:MAG: hypothetical protein JWN01_1104 [Patescibacteria group bacterium]|nr:hypothetical protein [Patescibacteria group bacterium]
MKKTIRKYWMELAALTLVVAFWGGVWAYQHRPVQDASQEPGFQQQVQEEAGTAPEPDTTAPDPGI